ncbi:MAG TPA: hypothetical protein VF362_04460 [Demequinaceae bacterium]
MAKLGGRVWALIAGAGALLALCAAAWFAGWWPFGGSGSEPTPTPSVSASPSASPRPSFVERQVTVAPNVPVSELLTAAVLDSAGNGWVVAVYDATSRDDTGVESPGPKALYLISPEGVRYEVGNLDTLGMSAPDLVAWDYARRKVLIVDNLMDMKVVDMMTGAIDGSWLFCDHEGYVRGSARDGAWLLRGSCNGEGIDGLYGDAGVEVPSSIVGKGFGLTVFDVGDVQVQSEFETAPDVRFTAFYADGTQATIPSSMAGDCYLLGKGKGDTFAAYCYTSAGAVDVWEFPVDGSTPVDVVTSAQLEAFRLELGVPNPADFFVSGYCSAADLPVVEVTWDQSRLGVLKAGSLAAAAQPPHPFRHCLAQSGTSALVSGDGLLWLTDFATGSTVELLPGSGASAAARVVGAAHVVGTEGYRALQQP